MTKTLTLKAKSRFSGPVLIVLLFGLALGMFTSFGQTYLPDPLTQLANSYSVWLLFAFACGMFMTRYRWALIGGALIQYIALTVYYLLLAVRFEDSGFNVSSNLIWLVGGTLAGPIAGFCGRLVAYGSKYAAYGAAFILATIFSESLYQFLQLRYIGEGIVFLSLGAVTAACLIVKLNNPLRAILPTLGLTVAAYLTYTYVLTSLFS